jgi:hypothetical protein
MNAITVEKMDEHLENIACEKYVNSAEDGILCTSLASCHLLGFFLLPFFFFFARIDK